MARYRYRLRLLMLLATVVAVVRHTSDALRMDPHGVVQVGMEAQFNISVPVGSLHTDYIAHKYASYIAVHFADFDLPLGDAVVVSSTDKSIKTHYAYTMRGRDDRSDFIASFIPGSEVSIEYVASNLSAPTNRTAYRIVGYSWGLPNRETESLCGSGDQALPALCYANGTELEAALPLAYEKSKAVARLLINGSWFCTGFLAGSEGHVFTNAHCFDYDQEAQSTDIEFGAESTSCSDLCADQLGCPGTVVATHATLLVRNEAIDYALLKLPEGTDTSAYGFLQFRESGPVKGEPIYVPQYPMGYAKRIASYTDDNSSTTIKAVNSSDVCGEHQVEHDTDTEPGASGSPLLSDEDNTVLAIHHCGGCNNMAIDVRDILADLENKSIAIRDLIAFKDGSADASDASDSSDSVVQQSSPGVVSASGYGTVTQDEDGPSQSESSEEAASHSSASIASEQNDNVEQTDTTTPAPTTVKTTTPRPVTVQPTPAPDTSKPAPAPTTVKPTPAPTTGKPTPAPTTTKLTPAPTTSKSTPAPTTTVPTQAPTTAKPTPASTTVGPTPAPTTGKSTPAQTMTKWTPTPTTDKLTPCPMTAEGTPAPTTSKLTPVPTTVKSTPCPTTIKSTPTPTTIEPTPAPTTTKSTPAPTTAKSTPTPTTAKQTPSPTPTSTGADGAGQSA